MNQYQTRLFEGLEGYPDSNVCWRWPGALNPHGYGVTTIGHHRTHIRPEDAPPSAALGKA